MGFVSDAQRARNARQRAIRRSRVGQVSLLAVLAAGAAVSSTDVRAERVVNATPGAAAVSFVTKGENGSDGVTPLLGAYFGEILRQERYPGQGQAGEALRSTGIPVGRFWSSTHFVNLQSTGGNGGDGKEVLLIDSAHYQGGGDGGAGGAISYSHNQASANSVAPVTGAGNKLSPMGLIELHSRGGEGGYSVVTPGRGGKGGDVELILADQTQVTNGGIHFSTQGDNLSVAWIRSTGGAAGDGGDRGGRQFGGQGGKVTATIGARAVLSSSGAHAPVLVVQSTGGAGGSHDSQGEWHPPSPAGAGGEATLNLKVGAKLSSSGSGSAGALVQSVGGLGGSNTALVGGASGSRGGAGGLAQATLHGEVTTTGENAMGVVVQSVGGAGGSGGRGIFSGGAGADAGNGGEVKVTAAGKITTSGQNSVGLVAQSVGGGKATNAFMGGLATPGGGGAGGSPLFRLFASGGSGGTGGTGGVVTVTHSGAIQTSGMGATGILAQSIGGGGGAGGNATAFGLFGGLALGGDGGEGATGGAVTVSNIAASSGASGSISTKGAFASGILAQSVGGGGGSGGDATAVTIGAHVAYARAIGGAGGKGGTGGAVTVTNDLNVQTTGMLAPGVVAMSIGGGGGYGGAATAKATAFAVKDIIPTFTATHAVGGAGGTGNAGGNVTARNSASITTAGVSSVGLMAMSVGGGGGDGGAIVPLPSTSVLGLASLLVSMKGSLADFTVNSGVGGNGGVGGVGGTVHVTNSGAITTGSKDPAIGGGQGATGILAMSVGGGGGRGGDANVTQATHFTYNESIGGKGGSGNHGGQVIVEHAKGASITTSGRGGHGIHGLSVGGGGGVGGGATATTGGSEWYSTEESSQFKKILFHAIKVGLPQIVGQNSFAITKFLADKIGVQPDKLASTGGALRALRSLLPLDVSWNVAVGGQGGAGGDGGGSEKLPVRVTSAGVITTHSDAAFGIAAQSIGGGGGAGGSGAAGSGKTWGQKIAVGGGGGSAGNGGVVLVEQNGTITTTGVSSFGVFAQSVGGGGGLATTGRDFQAGNSGMTGSAMMGGTDGASGAGGRVTISSAGTVTTSGKDAHALFAQSVGGGGGVAADTSLDLNALLEIKKQIGETKVIETFDAFGIDIRDDLKRAGAEATARRANGAMVLGGATGAGGAVNVQFTGASSISTTGHHAYGVLAQSVGGGGGSAGSAGFDGGARLLASGAHMVIGSVGPSSGSGGDVNVVSTNPGAAISITTTGSEAHGVFAQSIGGGGGLAGTFLTDRTGHGLTVVDAAKRQGLERLLGDKRVVAGDKALEALNRIPDQLLALYGLQAGSAQRGLLSALMTDQDTIETLSGKLDRFSRNRALSSGTGGAVTIDLANVTISAAGQDAFAIYGQSGFQKADGSLDPVRSGGVIKVNVAGTITGGQGRGAAIGIDGGSDNILTIARGSTISAASGNAILASFGAETINNHGLVIGDINLAVGNTTERNIFNNLAGATYRTADAGEIRLGGARGAGQFNNAGALDIGGVNNFATSSIVNGHAHLGGRLLVDVTSVAGAPQASDRLHVQDAFIEGVRVVPHAVQELLPGSSFTVLTADRLVNRQQAVSGSSLASPISWSVATGQNAVTITPGANFVAHAASKNLTNTERAYLGAMQQSWDNGDQGMADTFARIANITSARDYQEEISSRTATEEHAQSAAVQTLGARHSLRASLSCPAFEGSGVMLRENQCVWSRITGSREAQLNGHGHEGFTQTGVSYRVGAQWQVRPDWFVGVTAAYNTSWLNSSDRMTSSTGRGGDVAVALKYQTGAWLFAGALHAGYGSYDNRTLFSVGDAAWSSVNNTNVWTGGLRLRAAYELAFSNWYLRPYADLDALYTYQPGYVLAGANSFVRAHTMSEWSIAFEPGVEIGARINVGDSGWLRPYASIGGAFIHGDGLGHRASFGEGAGSGITYLSNTNVPEALLAVGGGVQFYANEVYELRGEYKAKLARDYIGQEASIRLSMRF